jgi:cell division protein FtsL
MTQTTIVALLALFVSGAISIVGLGWWLRGQFIELKEVLIVRQDLLHKENTASLKEVIDDVDDLNLRFVRVEFMLDTKRVPTYPLS